MKAKISILLLAAAAFSLAGQDVVHFTRQQKVGTLDKYKVHITGTSQYGDIDITGTRSEEVKKVYDNGDADIEAKVLSQAVTINGSEVPAPQDPTTTFKVDKNGIPVSTPSDQPGRLQFGRYLSAIFNKDLKVGDSIQVDEAGPDGKGKGTGTIKLDSVSNGDAKLMVNLTLTHASGEPTKFVGSFLVNTTDSKLDKIDATMDTLDLGPAVITNAKFVLERVHS